MQPPECRVEAADGVDGVSADGHACPEGRIDGEEPPVHQSPTRAVPGRIVRAGALAVPDHQRRKGIHLGCPKQGAHVSKKARREAYVVVDEQHDIAPGELHPTVPGRRKVRLLLALVPDERRELTQ